jgi:hypothetical protein
MQVVRNLSKSKHNNLSDKNMLYCQLTWKHINIIHIRNTFIIRYESKCEQEWSNRVNLHDVCTFQDVYFVAEHILYNVCNFRIYWPRFLCIGIEKGLQCPFYKRHFLRKDLNGSISQKHSTFSLLQQIMGLKEQTCWKKYGNMSASWKK